MKKAAKPINVGGMLAGLLFQVVFAGVVFHIAKRYGISNVQLAIAFLIMLGSSFLIMYRVSERLDRYRKRT